MVQSELHKDRDEDFDRGNDGGAVARKHSDQSRHHEVIERHTAPLADHLPPGRVRPMPVGFESEEVVPQEKESGDNRQSQSVRYGFSQAEVGIEQLVQLGAGQDAQAAADTKPKHP